VNYSVLMEKFIQLQDVPFMWHSRQDLPTNITYNLQINNDIA